MRFRLTICLLSVAMFAQADTIVLKNGNRIVADSAREKNGRVEYEIGDNTYAISKSLVERIDAGGVPIASGGSSRQADIPDYTPNDTLQGSDDLSINLVRGGRLDVDALAALERSGDPRNAAAGYFSAARFEHERGNRDKALIYLQRGLSFTPDNAVLLEHYAAVLVQVGRSSEAIVYAERAVRSSPSSVDALNVLGYAYFGADRTRDAVRTWKKSLAIRPDSTVQSYLERAERELTAEADYKQRDSGHFTLKYEGRSVPEALTRDILATLEAHYDDLVRTLGVTPRSSIGVVLYTEQAFFDVTRSPAWSGALNDGKIRVPIEGVTSVSTELSRVLRHELAHSFITFATRGRCPHWLHEGIAQYIEPRSIASYGASLSRLYGEQRQVPLNALEGSFMGLNERDAIIAYTESLAAVTYIADTYGVSDVRLVLERIGQGSSPEAALRTTVHGGYSELERDLTRYLKDRYGE